MYVCMYIYIYVCIYICIYILPESSVDYLQLLQTPFFAVEAVFETLVECNWVVQPHKSDTLLVYVLAERDLISPAGDPLVCLHRQQKEETAPHIPENR